ncbi:hypothetical protein BDR26DRAFT_867365 [Obelidium mucronatum]|nr:hypothetical protein BDR26DRAFT_867365 [Obelidium mucronatum]
MKSSNTGSPYHLQKSSHLLLYYFSFQNFCSIAYEASYIYYSYLRAEPILGQVFSSIAWHVSIAVKASPFLLLIQFTFFPLSGIQFEDPQLSKNLVLIGNCIGMLNGLLIITFDILCVITFVRYLKSTQVEEGDVDERFLIISRYGIAPPVLCIVGLGLYLYYSVVAESEVLLFCIYLLFTAVFLILFRMKVALHREKVAKENKRRSRIESVQSTATNGGRGGEGSSIRNVAATNSAPDMQTSRSFTKIGNIGKRQ